MARKHKGIGKHDRKNCRNKYDWKRSARRKNIRENGWSFSPKAPISLKEAKRQVEKELILKAYGEYKSTYKVAEVLQVDQSTISKKLKVYKKEGF